ncbi:hypothetical protein G9A89_010840 [Geosiphon pyriformis]|nr:hypothetical protein G9A89_010840 [Geosiphon pyriformis]
MKVVALISGGKDSCFNMMHCVKNGHEIVALANLKPPDSSNKDELDSFLYQTVGHEAIEYYAECMGLPLYRRQIFGNSVFTGPEYHITKGDETEDLFELLNDVKKKHPELQGVSVGAILSNYQRVRVEHVCDRLELMSLAYLWRRNQKELLKEMIEAKIDAIMIKVAAMGLKPLHLGKSIGEMYSYLCNIVSLLYEHCHENKKYDVHVCGEGGEYETLTLDCPLFVKSLRVEETETIIHSDDAFAPVAYLRIKKLALKEKSPSNFAQILEIEKPSWEFDISNLLSLINILPSEESLKLSKKSLKISFNFPKDVDLEDNQIEDPFTAYAKSPYFAISGITAYHDGSTFIEKMSFPTIEEETRACMLNIQDRLEKLGLTWSEVVNMNVFIKNMSDFIAMNKVYKSFFDINPATRACVGANLPSPLRLQIDLTAIKTISNHNRDSFKQVMHVQSISYWAPANIGPYSQAIILQNHGYIAGQIGLIPSSLQFPPENLSNFLISPQQKHQFDSLTVQIGLSLRNLENIATAINLDVRKSTVICICFVDDDNAFPSVVKAWNIFCSKADQRDKDVQIDKLFSANLIPSKIPLLYLKVPSLPRAAKVEWQVLVHSPSSSSGNIHYEDFEQDDNLPKDQPLTQQFIITDDLTMTTITTCYLHPIITSVVKVKLSSLNDDPISIRSLINILITGILKAVESDHPNNQPWTNIVSVRVFYSEKFIIESNANSLERAFKSRLLQKILSYQSLETNPISAISFIPVLSIMDNCIFGACIHGVL